MFQALSSLVIGLVLVFDSNFSPSNKSPSSVRQELNLIPPPPGLERWTFGYNDVVADTLWIRLIQDFHICESAKDGIAHPPRPKGTVPDPNAAPACRKGWVYQMLSTISNLAPKWRLPYSTGGLMLSIIVDDREGATDIFNRGIEAFPEDYNIAYNASYHFMWEEKNPKRAGDLLVRAAKNGGEPWLYSLAGKMYSEAGQAELAKGVVENALKQANTPEIEDRLKHRLEDIERQIAKDKSKK